MEGGEEEMESEADEEETPASEDGEEETPPASRAPAGKPSSKPATASQIRSACSGASPEFVLGCVEGGLTLAQSVSMFGATKSPRVPAPRGRRTLPASRAGADASPTSGIEGRIAELTRGKIAEGKSRDDALAAAMSVAKNEDPEGFFAYTRAREQQRAREMIGAAAND